MTMIKIEGKSIEKLIEVASKGMGVLYKPRAIRKEADAEAYKEEVLAKANAKSFIIEGEAKIELYKRARQRLANQEINRQVNIEDIVEKSIPFLEETEVSETPVEDDWRVRFFEKAQDVSDEDMQNVWAKILAEEVTTPGKIGLRTLDIVSNMSKLEAEKFQVACSLSAQFTSIYKLKEHTGLFEFGLSYPDLMTLREAGLLNDSDNLISNLLVIKELGGSVIVLGTDLYIIKAKTEPQPEHIVLNQFALTKAGKGLCAMLKIPTNNEKIPTNNEYINKLVSELEERFILEKKQVTKGN